MKSWKLTIKRATKLNLFFPLKNIAKIIQHLLEANWDICQTPLCQNLATAGQKAADLMSVR